MLFFVIYISPTFFLLSFFFSQIIFPALLSLISLPISLESIYEEKEQRFEINITTSEKSQPKSTAYFPSVRYGKLKLNVVNKLEAYY